MKTQLFKLQQVISVTAIVLLLLTGQLACPGLSHARTQSDDLIVQAKKAYQLKNNAELAALRDAAIDQRHPLAGWVDHWQMQSQLKNASANEVNHFLTRWGDDYVADRLRNDWLLELGKRRDWPTFLRVLSDFKMNDDLSVTCYAMLARFETNPTTIDKTALAEQARQAWWQQNKPDEGCHAMAEGLLAANILNSNDIWRKIWLSNDNNQKGSAGKAAALLDDSTQQAYARASSQPELFLTRGQVNQELDRSKKAQPFPPSEVPLIDASALNLQALQLWGAQDIEAAAKALSNPEKLMQWRMSNADQAWAWASLGRRSASKLEPQAMEYFDRAWSLGGLSAAQTWSTDTQTWWARAAVRAATSDRPNAWASLALAISAMTDKMQQDPTWVYWRARALMAQAPTGSKGEAQRQQSRQLMAQIARKPLDFYGLLARDELGESAPSLPAPATALTSAELAQARSLPGLRRALHLYSLDLRSEGAREWNYTLSFSKPGGMNDRELMAAAEWACEREVWDRCINTSERTKQEINWAQRYPVPFKNDILRAATSMGVDPAYMIGLIRQESRFHVAARSSVGAAGLMQVMPATASWTARKLGMNEYHNQLIDDTSTNLKLGAGYLKLMFDEFAGSQAMAAAGYNAGPNRPRRWRNGPQLEAAAWAENIPFSETRDYVKKVMANAAVYAYLLQGKVLNIKNRLGPVGPKTKDQGPDNKDLP